MLLEDRYELKRSDIIDGEIIEFEPVEKPKRERNPMYLASMVDMVMEAIFSDLRDALNQNDQLSDELNAVKGQVDQANADAQNASEAAQIKQSDLKKLQEAEALFADLEQTIEQFKQKRKEDSAHIQALSERVNANNVSMAEMEAEKNRLESRDKEREAELEEITENVNEVLLALQERFEHLTVEA